MLTKQSPKYWAPIKNVTDWVEDQVPTDANVLEIGAGLVPFSKARTFVDFDENRKVEGRFVRVDTAIDPLPFKDKEFDFVYCRHVLEDMYNPFLLCREMSRVAKAGYIETPSPIAEFARGVDGGSPLYRGYHHHRYFVWDDDGTLSFVAKLPMIEHIETSNERLVDDMLRYPALWNTYFLWRDEIKIKHYQCPLDFDITTQMSTMVRDAICASCNSTQKFWTTIKVATS